MGPAKVGLERLPDRLLSDGRAARLAFALAWAGGMVDATGFLTLARLFTAHMSGNSAALGAYLGTGDWAEALHRLTPIPLFVVGVAIGAALIEAATRLGIRSSLSVALAAEGLLLLGFRVYGGSTAYLGALPATATWQLDLLTAFLALAMGIQGAALQRVGGATVHTTYITGMLTNLAKEVVAYAFWRYDRRQGGNASAAQGIVPARPSLFRALLVVGIWCAFVSGAVIGGFAIVHWGLNGVDLPLIVLAAIIGTDLRRPIYDAAR
jgi:uncharacterized membrane protein YoaK (UPF0700 family)